MATIPVGSLVFSGFGDAPCKFASPAGVDLGVPASAPWIGNSDGGGGCEGIVQLDTGEICATGSSGDVDPFNTVLAYSSQFVQVGGYQTLFSSGESIASDYSSHFLCLRRQAGAGAGLYLHTISPVGALLAETLLESGTFTHSGVLGISPDRTIAYYGFVGGNTVSKNVISGPTVTTFATETGYTLADNNLLVLRNGEILIAWRKSVDVGYVKHYSAAGALLHTYALPGTNPSPIVLTPGLTDTSFWVGYYNAAVATSSGVTIAELAIGTGTVLESFAPDDGAGFEYDGEFCVVRVVIDPPAAPDECAVTLELEDPCTMTQPFVWGEIVTPSNPAVSIKIVDRLHFSDRPQRDPLSYHDGYKPPRLLTWGPIVRSASNIKDGRSEASGLTFTLADTDGVVRGRLAAAGGSFVNSAVYFFTASERQRLALGPARQLFQGVLSTDSLGPHRTYVGTGRDVLSASNSLVREEPVTPPRFIEADFPDFGLQGTNTTTITVLRGTIIAGLHSDEATVDWIPGQTKKLGRVPVWHVGPTVCADGVTRPTLFVSAHANHLGVLAAYDKDGVSLNWGVDGWAPGQAGWASVNPSGAALYTVVNGRTYTLMFLSGAIGDAVTTNNNTICVNTWGITVYGDGTGGPITNLQAQYKWWMLNCVLSQWQTGPWLASPTFRSPAEDGAIICRMLTSSWDAAAVTGELYVPGGFKGAWVLGLNGQELAVSDVQGQFNVQAHVRLGTNRWGQLFVVMFDRRRSEFVAAGGRAIDAVRDTLSSQPFTAPLQDEALYNNLRVGFRQNYRINQFEALAQAGDTVSQQRFGDRPVETESWTLIADNATAAGLGEQVLAFAIAARRLPTWLEGRCGLRHDLLDRVTIRHPSDLTSGTIVRGAWVEMQQVAQPGTVGSRALDVEDLLVGDGHQTTILSGIALKGTAPYVGFSQALTTTASYTTGPSQDVTARARYTSSDPLLATVTVDGLVTGVGAGSVTITATYQEGPTSPVSAHIDFAIVVAPALTLSSVTVSGLAPLEGGTSQLTATAHWSDGQSSIVTNLATWGTSDAGVITVNATGRATGVSGGTADVTATYQSRASSPFTLVVATPSLTDLYVATTGNDGASGAVGSPFKTIGFGLGRISAGSTLYVRGGTYNEGLMNNIPSGTSWGNTVRIAAYPSETVWLQPGTTAAFCVLLSEHQQYIEIDGINMRSSTGVEFFGGTVKIACYADTGSNPHHIRIKNAELIIGSDGVTDQGTHSAHLGVLNAANYAGCIGGNEFLNLTVHGGGDAGDYSTAFYIETGNNLVDGCNCYDVAGWSIQSWNDYGFDPDGNIFRNNIVHDNTRSPDGRMDGIVNGGTNTQIYNNLVYRIGGSASGGGIYCYKGSGWVYNNTVYGGGLEGIIAEIYATDTVIRNNIAYLNAGGNFRNNGTRITADHNLTNGTNPLFTNPAGGDFTLAGGSPALAAGTTPFTSADRLGTPWGSPPNMGCYA